MSQYIKSTKRVDVYGISGKIADALDNLGVGIVVNEIDYDPDEKSVNISANIDGVWFLITMSSEEQEIDE